MSDPGSEVSNRVWVKGGSTGQNLRYHTDPDCKRMRGRHTPKDFSLVPEEYEECEWCSGSVDLGPPTGEKLATRLAKRGESS